MEKKELFEKICCYLPYKVWATSVHNSYEFVIHGITESDSHEASPVVLDGLLDEFGFSEFKLKLIPLSKFKELDSKEMSKIDAGDVEKYCIMQLATDFVPVKDCWFSTMEICFKNHIDVFGLIDQGQAIDKTK